MQAYHPGKGGGGGELFPLREKRSEEAGWVLGGGRGDI